MIRQKLFLNPFLTSAAQLVQMNSIKLHCYVPADIPAPCLL